MIIMNKVLLNQELTITIPDGFRQMTEEELRSQNLYKEPPKWCITDPARHIVVSAAWKKSTFASLMISSEEVAKKMENEIRTAMTPYGYQLEGFISEEAGGHTLDGFRYSYTAQGIEMTGETFSVKKDRTFYYIHCYMRTALREESIPVIRELFRSFE